MRTDQTRIAYGYERVEIMPPYETKISDMFMMNEKGEPVKITGFSEMQNWEVRQDPGIDLKKLYESKFEGTIQLTPESEAELKKLQEQLNAEIIENLREQITAIDNFITAKKYCGKCSDKCPYRGSDCIERLKEDAIAIAEAYRRVVESGLKMMEEKSDVRDNS